MDVKSVKSHSLILLSLLTFNKLLHHLEVTAPHHRLMGLVPLHPHVDQPAERKYEINMFEQPLPLPDYLTQGHHQAHGAEYGEHG